MPSPLRLGILGSCVSRDMAALHGECSVSLYVARQSWISATSPGVSVPAGPRLTSPFQQRMLESDLGSTGLRLLASMAPELDLLLIDLVDERLGVVPLKGRAYATDSQELKDSGTKELLESTGSDLELGTPEHLERWSRAARAVVDELAMTGLLERTVVLRTPFADTTVQGTPVAPFMGIQAKEWDRLYSRYFDHLEQLGLRIVTLPRELAVSDEQHRWGPSPYHYQPAAYSWLLRAARHAARLDDDALDPEETRRVRMPLSAPVAGITNPAAAGTVRLPVDLGVNVRRWRLRIRNYNQRTGRGQTGQVDVTGVWFGVHAGSGAFAAEPAQLVSARSVPTGGLVTPWFDEPLGAGPCLLSIGWRAETPQSVVLSLADAFRSANPSAAGEPADEGFVGSRYVPFSWALDLDVQRDVPVVLGWGDERLQSHRPTALLSDSPVARAARAVGGIPVQLAYPGSSLEFWLRYRSQWSGITASAPYTEIFAGVGMRDVLQGASAAEMRTRYTETLQALRDRGRGPVTVVLLDEHLPDPGHADVAREVNRWLVDTYPGPVCLLRNGAFEPLINRPRSGEPSDDQSDGHETMTP